MRVYKKKEMNPGQQQQTGGNASAAMAGYSQFYATPSQPQHQHHHHSHYQSQQPPQQQPYPVSDILHNALSPSMCTYRIYVLNL